MPDRPVGRIVVLPIDCSFSCVRAFNWFIKYIHHSNDVVYFAHVMQPKSAHHNLVLTMNRPMESVNQSFSIDYTGANDLLEKYRKLAEAANINCSSEILAGASVADTILHFAVERQANLIVVPSRGAGVLRRTFLGSVSRHLVTHSALPVLVVPPTPRHMSSTYP